MYKIEKDIVPSSVKASRNSRGTWTYGYNKEFDIIVISKDGTIGDIYNINDLLIALPKEKKCEANEEGTWAPHEIPKELASIKSQAEWNVRTNEFKSKYIDYIEGEFDKRANGHWFLNKGIPTYLTGSHYMYLQWTKIDVGLPEFRESNRIFYIFWEACKADNRCYGICYLKNRRSGFSFMSGSECSNIGTITRDARLGILSKTGADAKKLFTEKVVPMGLNYPFFFRPIQDGMDRPKMEISYRVPASRLTRKTMFSTDEEELDGLNTVIDWQSTTDNSYDGAKLKFLLQDECYDPETLILASDWTFKKIKDLKIGDKVFVEGGIEKTIVNKTEGITDTYRIKQPYGKDYVVTENHRLVLNHYYNKGHKEVIMTPKEYMSSSRFKKQHLTRVTSNGIESDDKNITIPPYLLGMWLGDGRQSAFTILVNKDEEPELLAYLGRIAEMRNIDFELKKSTSKKIVEFAFKGINKELRDIGVYNNKHIPDIYMQSSIEARLQLLAGLVDTDGYSDHKKGSIELGMSRKDLIEKIRFLALSCGLSCSNIKHKISNFNTDVYRICISGDLSIIPILTEKKSFDNYKPKTKGRRNKVDVEYIGKGNYVGIQVDGENDNERKLILEDFTVSLNSGKWVKPENILNNWKVTKTCLRLGKNIVGKCMMGSTSNALSKGGAEFKELFEKSNPRVRNNNGQTTSGLYALFIPMEWNFEGYIDKWGFPILEVEKGKSVETSDGEFVSIGVIEHWNNEVESLKNDSDALNEHYRQFPRTESHAFRDESISSLFNLTKIYQQIDYNEGMIEGRTLTRGYFSWYNGEKDTKVIWTPDNKGRFLVSWIPPAHLQNNVAVRNNLRYPLNEHLGIFGCDSYDISGVVGGGGSNGALHGLTKFHMEQVPTNHFFLEYISRPQTAEIFYEDVIMAIHFYGMQILAENNKPRLLYHLKNRGYRPFSMNRPDKPLIKLSVTERELGGIPNTSEDVKQAHADAIQTYIEKYVGYDLDGTYRDSEDIGDMFFNKTLQSWAKFDINNRTKFDASISSGLAIMAGQRHLYVPKTENTKISIKFAKYDNSGRTSQILNNER